MKVHATIQRLSQALLVALLFLIPASGFGQGNENPNIPDDVKNSNAFKRAQWFIDSRDIPSDEGKPAEEYFRLLTNEMERTGYYRKTETGGEFAPPPPAGSLSWSNIGPAGIQANGALNGSGWGTVSGRVRALAVHPSDANTAYIGAAAGGIWKTTNGGTSWSDIGAGLASLTFGAIGIDPNNPNTVYAGGGEILYNFNPWLYDGQGLFKSTNGGSTWTNITNGFGSQTHFGAIAVSKHNSNYVFAALGSGYWHLGSLSNEGVWRSTDAGTTWTKVLAQTDAHDVWVHPDSANYIYAAIGGAQANAGIWRSTDNGVNWTKTSVGLPSGGSIGRIQAAQSPSSPATMFAIIYGAGTKLYKTTDGGAGWFQVSVGVQLGGNYGDGWRDQGWYDLCVAVHPTNPSIVMTGNVELHRTTNGADMSVLRTNPAGAWFSPCHVDYHIIRFSPSTPNTVYLGCDGGVYKSTDAGATWASVNNGINTIQFYRIASDPNNKNKIFGGAQDNGNFRTTNGGTAWGMTTTGDGMYCAVDRGNSSIVYASTQYGSHYKSVDGGASFADMAYTNAGWLSPLVIHPTNSSTLYVMNTSIYKSTNSGTSFPLLASGVASDYINSFDISPVNPAKMAFSANDAFSNLGQVRVSSDSGSTWTTVSGSIGGTTRYISRVVMHPTQENTLFAVRSGFVAGEKIFRSTNLGSTWTNITGNLPNIPHNDIVVDPIHTDEYYVANDFGVYHTTDAGATWTREGTGMPFVPAMDLEIMDFGTDRVLRAGTHGRSLYEAALDLPIADLEVTSITSNAASIVTGQNVTYTITINNIGTATATNVTLTDNLPSTLTYVSCNVVSGPAGACGGAGNNRTIAWASFPAGQTAVVTIVATVNCNVANGTIITNNISIASVPADGSLANNTGSRAITASNPAPVFATFPADIIANTGPGNTTCTVVVSNLGSYSVTDNCAGVTVAITGVPPANTYPLGATNITYTATDAGGAVTVKTQKVTVVDNTPPVAICPAGTTVEADNNDKAPVPNAVAGTTATDNCTASGSLVKTQNPLAGTLVGLGVNNITVSVKDQANNTGTCNTTLTVIQRVIISPSVPELYVAFGCASPLSFSKSFTINNSGGHFGGGLLQWTATTSAAPITITSAAGFEGDQCVITVNPAGLAPGNYTYYLTITAWNSVSMTPGKNSPYQFPVYVRVEPNVPSVTQTNTVTNSWTAFTNSYGQTFAEVKSNGGNIAGFTVTAYPCTNPPTYPRVNFARRYWKYTAPGAVNVDIRGYYTDSEGKPRVVQPANLVFWQQAVVPGTWVNKGGTSNTSKNYVELTGVTNTAGNWMVAHPWVAWYPKPIVMNIAEASYNRSTRMNDLSWSTQINTEMGGFIIERTFGADPDVNDWHEVGALEFSRNGSYRFSDPVEGEGTYFYRVSTWDREGNYFVSPEIRVLVSKTPGDFNLAQNYPNPFNPETVIAFTLPATEQVSLKVYDMYWREIATLVNGVKPAGTHEVRFNASGLPSGTYFYRIQAGVNQETRKMSLTK